MRRSPSSSQSDNVLPHLLSAGDQACMLRMDPVFAGEPLQRFPPLTPLPDRPHISLRQLRLDNLLPFVMRSITTAVRRVLLPGLPLYVAGVPACGRVTGAMAGYMIRRRPWAVRPLASQVMNQGVAAIDPELAVPVGRMGVGPQDAFVSSPTEVRPVELQRLTQRSPARGRITMAPLTVVMAHAQPLAARWFLAPLHRACLRLGIRRQPSGERIAVLTPSPVVPLTPAANVEGRSVAALNAAHRDRRLGQHGCDSQRVSVLLPPPVVIDAVDTPVLGRSTIFDGAGTFVHVAPSQRHAPGPAPRPRRPVQLSLAGYQS